MPLVEESIAMGNLIKDLRRIARDFLLPSLRQRGTFVVEECAEGIITISGPRYHAYLKPKLIPGDPQQLAIDVTVTTGGLIGALFPKVHELVLIGKAAYPKKAIDAATTKIVDLCNRA